MVKQSNKEKARGAVQERKVGSATLDSAEGSTALPNSPQLNKEVIKWLHRVLAEKTEETKKIQEGISILNHQIQNFHAMPDAIKDEVIDELVSVMAHYNWGHEAYALKMLQEKEKQNDKRTDY